MSTDYSNSRTETHSVPTPQPDTPARDVPPQVKDADPQLSGSTPGSEFPSAIYVTIVAAFAWTFFAAWLAFAREPGIDLDLSIVTVLAAVFLAVPIIMCLVAAARNGGSRRALKGFASSPVDTYTGSLRGGEAWLQVLLPPMALAVAATLIGAVYVLS